MLAHCHTLPYAERLTCLLEVRDKRVGERLAAPWQR
jgi:hypothetical protein